MTGQQMNDAIARRAVKSWGTGKRSYWLIENQQVVIATADTPGAVEGYGIYDGQVIGADELANALASGRLKSVAGQS